MTVPASFDAVARELTLEGRRAGRLSEHHAAGRAAGGLLCVDRAAPGLARAGHSGRPHPGGGYRRRHHGFHADCRDGARAANWRLNRMAVGEHILLGGDNIDLALAGLVADRLAEKGTQIDSLPAAGAVEQLPRRQGKAARSGLEEERGAGHDSGQGHGAGGRHHQGDAASRATWSAS